MFQPVSSDGEKALGWMNSLHAKRVKKFESEIEPDQDIDGEADLRYLKSLDPVEWKDQDHYKVIGLFHLRERASEEDIKKACKFNVKNTVVFMVFTIFHILCLSLI